MLSLAKAAKDYYLRKLSEISPREDYYLRGGTATGHWWGSGAADLGLEGVVSAEGLVRLFDGEHPGTGERLGRQLRKDGVAAWDVTFSADKSVSLLWALGDEATRKEVVEAFEEATAQAFGYLETVASSTRGARNTRMVDEHGHPVLNQNGTPKHRVETWPIATSGYMAAAFTEFTSRADDPQLHTHVVIANKVKGVDGRWRTIDGRLLYRHQLAAGYLHEAVLRKELGERLGVRWQPVQNGMADIEGFTRHQIEAFSQRRQQLEEWRQEQGLSDTPASRQVAVLATRGPKRDHRLEELEVEWRQRAVEVGLTCERIARIVGRDRTIAQPDPEMLFNSLASPDGLTAQASTFAKPEVVKEIAAALPRGGTREDIEVLADTFLGIGEVIPLLPATGIERSDPIEVVVSAAQPASVDAPNEAVRRPMWRGDGKVFPSVELRQYTTAELLATEQRIVQHAMAGVGAGRWVIPTRLVEAMLRRHRHLTEGQREMVRRFATSGNTVDVGIGPAGSGKTAVMKQIGQLATMTGTPIVGAALAARAAAGLQAATGIPSTTLARLLGHGGDQTGLPPGVLMVVDEAGMVGTRQLAAVFDLVKKSQGKLILIGDDHQLSEIEAGGLFQALANRLPAVTLSDNIRQRNEWERVALTELRDGSVEQAIDLYRQHRRLVVEPSREETLTRAARDWYRHVTATGDLTDGLLIGYDNNTVAQLNEEARSLLSASERLHGPTLQAGQRDFQAGDRIICRSNQRRLDVHNGDLGTVVSINPDQGSLTVRLDRDPETRELPGWYLNQEAVDHGYAMTGHKAQGVTTGRTFTIIGGNADREWTYVALSRGRQANTLYLNIPQPDDEQCAHLTHPQPRAKIGQVARSLGRSSAQIAAIDHVAPGSSSAAADINTLAAFLGDGDLERIIRLVAQRRAQLEERKQGVGLALGP